MKKIIMLISFICLSNVGAVEYKKKVECRDGICKTEERYSGLDGRELTIRDIKPDMCLFTETGKGAFYRVFKVDVSNKRMEVVSETSESDYIVEMKKEVVYSDSKHWNPHLRIIPCDQVNGYIINEESRYAKCVTNNPSRSLKLFCQKERLKNF